MDNPHLGLSFQAFTKQQGSEKCQELDYIVTSYSPQTSNTKGNHNVQRFCAILNQEIEMDLTNVPSQTRQTKRNNALYKSIVIDQVRKKCSEPDLDNNKHGDNQST